LFKTNTTKQGRIDMGDWWSDQASDLQYRVKVDEQELTIAYSEEEIQQAIVNTRQDVVLLYSVLCSANKQLRTIRRLGICVLLVLIVIAVNI
jgi:hypothetical protein